MGTSLVVVGVGIFVKIRNPNRRRGGKFQNPLRNMNLTIAIVILFSTLLYVIAHYVDLPEDLLFPRVPMGFDMVALAAIFFFCSPDMKAHAARRFPFFSHLLRVQRNSIKPHQGNERGNVIQMNHLGPSRDIQ